MDEIQRDLMKECFPILHYFDGDNLPENERDISDLVESLAYLLAVKLPFCHSESEDGFRKLLEARASFLRAAPDRVKPWKYEAPACRPDDTEGGA